MIKKRENTTK